MLPVSIHGPWFRDSAGRTLILRGVNLAGSSKLPSHPNGATHLPNSLAYDPATSFIGRPFPLEEADEHFGRLRAWGFNLVRLLVTWEAIEHAGPGIYDEAFLDWFAQIVERAADYDLYVFVDFHQDVWGRWSGGDGAPYWTYTSVGLVPEHFDATEAAVTMQRRYPDDYPQMSWGGNYMRFASSTMFTLFFGGNDFAPNTTVEGQPVQEFLQSHFLRAVSQLVRRIAHLPHVIGYDAWNEPNGGYIGQRLDEVAAQALPGPRPTPFESMQAAAGFACEVAEYSFVTLQNVRTGTRLFNPHGLSAWHDEADDIWQREGLWTIERGQPTLLRPEHFTSVDGRSVEFGTDYFKPFLRRFAATVHQLHPEALIFIENEPFQSGGYSWGEPDDTPHVVHASHWYDVATLFTKRFNPYVSVDIYQARAVLGPAAITTMFSEQIAAIKQHSLDRMNNAPTLIGEFGLAYDLDNKAAYQTNDFSTHIKLLDMYYTALDTQLVSSTQWNYTPDNSNEWGDLWNNEDLSIFSRDQQHDPSDINSGGRAVEGFCRPYARRIAGEASLMRFDRTTGLFELRYQSDPSLQAPSEIYLPLIHYPQGFELELSSGSYECDQERHLLFVFNADPGEQSIVVKRR